MAQAANCEAAAAVTVVADQSSSLNLLVTSTTMPLHHDLNGGDEDDFWGLSQPITEPMSLHPSPQVSRSLDISLLES